MTPAFIAIGSNISPEENVRAAVGCLALTETLLGLSTVYRTAAEGRPEQSAYYNCVVAITTSMPPADLKFGRLRQIEQELGRTRSDDKYAGRTMDLDLIWYDNLVMKSPELTLPDPDILRRPFLAVPLWELAPDLVFPDTGRRLADVAAGMDRSGLESLPAYTDLLRREAMATHKL